MDTIIDFIHSIVRVIITVVAFIVIDLPLKFISIVFFLILGIVASVLYPLYKKIKPPRIMETWYTYLTDNRKLVSRQMFRLWSP